MSKGVKDILCDCNDLTLKFKRRIENNLNKNNQTGGNQVENLYLYINKHD